MTWPHAVRTHRPGCVERLHETYGGFEHNLQSLRVVDLLEQRYAAFDGLNLTFETRKAYSSTALSRMRACSATSENVSPGGGSRCSKRSSPISPTKSPTQSRRGRRAAFRLLTLRQLADIRIFARHMKAVLKEHPRLAERRLIHETVRRIIDTLVTDLIRASARNIRSHAPGSVEEVRAAPPLIAFSRQIRDESLELKRFLHEHLYRHYRVVRMSAKARRIVTEIFQAFLSDTRLLRRISERAQKDAPGRLPTTWRDDGSLRHTGTSSALRHRTDLSSLPTSTSRPTSPVCATASGQHSIRQAANRVAGRNSEKLPEFIRLMPWGGAGGTGRPR